MKRPLFVIGMAVFLSTAAALFFGDNVAAAVGVFLLFCAVLAPFVLRSSLCSPRVPRAAVCVVLLFGALSMGNVLLQNILFVRPVAALAEQTVYLTGRIREVEYGTDSASYLLDASIPLQTGGTVKTSVMLKAFTPLPVEPNDAVQGYVSLYSPTAQGKYRFSYLSRRIVLFGYFPGEYTVHPGKTLKPSPGYFVTALRERLIALNRRLLPPSESGLISAMLFGQKAQLSPQTQLEFKRAGVIHLCAVSGFHLTLVTALVVTVLGFFGFSKRARALCALPVMFLFMAVAGFTASVLRAGLMTGLFFIAQCLDEEYDALSSLGFALGALCLINPFSTLNAGFLLSFSATAGILLLSAPLSDFFKKAVRLQRFEGRIKLKRGIELLCASFSVSLGAFILSLPVSLFYFDSFSVVAPIASTVIMPVAGAALSIAAVALVIGSVPLFLPVAQALSAGTVVLSRAVLALVRFFSQWPLASLPSHFGFIKLLAVAFYLGGILLVLCGAQKATKRLCLILAAAVFCVGLVSHSFIYRGTVRVIAFQGMDASLLIHRNNAALIGLPKTPYEAYVLESFLRSENIWRLELAISTARDNEEAAGAAQLIETFKPRAVMIPSEGRYTPHIVHAAQGASSFFVPRKGTVTVLGTRIRIIDCSCGCACEISVGDANLLKRNRNCVIMDYNANTQGVVDGWILVRQRTNSGKMKVYDDGEDSTTYTFRLQESGGNKAS